MVTIVNTLFEWDSDKDAANVAKHGVGFARACGIFDGPIVTAVDGRRGYGEVRMNSIGQIGDGLVLVVTHTERAERTRIISARPAKRVERLRYAQALRQRADHPGTGSTPG